MKEPFPSVGLQTLCKYYTFLKPRIYCLGDSPVLGRLKASSSILQGEIAFMKQLRGWLKKKCNWNLCYRASRDGWSVEDFHAHCNNKGPTVVLTKVNNYIFGGYTDQDWVGM